LEKKKSHAVGENLTMPACKFLVCKMLGQNAVRDIGNVPHSNSTINRCIDDMSHDAEESLRHKRKNNSSSIHINESTYFTDRSYIVASVRFVIDSEIQEEFSVVTSCPKQAKENIYLTSCHHTWKQSYVLRELCRHLY
jgi:hypothetical protein